MTTEAEPGNMSNVHPFYRDAVDQARKKASLFHKIISAAVDMQNPFLWVAVDSLATSPITSSLKLSGILERLSQKSIFIAAEVVAWGLRKPDYFSRLFVFTTAEAEWNSWACSILGASHNDLGGYS